MNDLADVLYILGGSTWDVTDPARGNLWRWAVESFEPLVSSGAMMDMVRGREISRSGSPDHAVGHTTAAAILRMTSFARPETAAPLKAVLREWYLSDAPRATGPPAGRSSRSWRSGGFSDEASNGRGELLGSWVFAAMDRVVHRRPGWALGLAMHSSRVYNYESINTENLRGWHTTDGMTYLYNDDLTQFSDNFWPTVDPQRLPGTTVIAGSTARQSQTGWQQYCWRRDDRRVHGGHDAAAAGWAGAGGQRVVVFVRWGGGGAGVGDSVDGSGEDGGDHRREPADSWDTGVHTGRGRYVGARGNRLFLSGRA